MKKRYPILACCGLVAVIGAAATIKSVGTFYSLNAADKTYTLSVDGTKVEAREVGGDYKYYVKTETENDVEMAVTGSGTVQISGSNFVLNDGAIWNVTGIQALQSLTVNFEGVVTLDYGFMAGTYLSVNNTLTTGVALDLSEALPTHFRLNGVGATTISSVVATYSCDPAVTGIRSTLTQDWHMVGAGSFLGEHDGEWAPGAGPKLTVNPTNDTEVFVADIELKAGDVFKFVKGVTWDVQTYYSSYKIKTGNGSAFDLGKLTADSTETQDNGNITVVEDGTYSFYLGLDKTTGAPAAYDGDNAGTWAGWTAPVLPSTIKTLYVKAPSWWLADGAYCGIYYWSTGNNPVSWPGTRMTLVAGTTDTFSFEIDTANYKNCIFTRVNGGTGAVADWGAKTADLVIPTDDKNFYTITSTSPVWGNPGVTGTWSVK